LRAEARLLLREGQTFKKLLKEGEESQWLDDQGLAKAQAGNLRALLNHAVQTVPFYRELEITPSEIDADPLGVLHHRFPVIDKAIVRSAGLRMLSEKHSPGLVRGSTSGTTGSPLTLAQDFKAISRENAFVTRQLQWAGYKPGDRRAWIRGELIVPAHRRSPPYWRHNYAEQMLMLSSYHLSAHSAQSYIDALTAFAPTIIQAYPSSIGFLAKCLHSSNKKYTGKLKGIFTSSETLDADLRQLIEIHFGCRVFDWYGQFERVAAIGTCEHGKQHLVSDYSFVELLPVDDGLFEIIGTGFNNFAMPLIRYRTGDFVAVESTAAKCACGRHFPLVAAIQGRADDTVKLPNGRHIGRLDHIFKGVDGILEAQIRQDEIDRIDILVVVNANYGPAVRSRLLANAYERLGNDLQIEVTVVDGIARSNNGKFSGVVCNVV
jgi:phenylacetate-CoA ligase